MKALLMLALVLLGSCGQDQSKTSSKFLSGSEKSNLATDCENVNFHTNVLTKKSLQEIFKCLSWSAKYPKINEFIAQTSEDKLNNSLEVPNQLFFESTETRNRFLDFVKNNISLGSILEIKSLVNRSTSDSSSFKALSLSLRNKHPIPRIKGKTLSVITDSLSIISTELKDSLVKTSKVLKKNKTFYNNLTPVLLSVVDGFVARPKEFFKMTNSLLAPDIKFVSQLNSLKKADFKSLLYYPRGRSYLRKNAARLEEIIKNNEYSCSDSTDIYSLNQAQELMSRMHDLKALGQRQFLYSLYDLRLKFTLFNNICYYEELDSLVKVFLDDLIEFSLSPVGFNTLKRVALGSDDNYSLFQYISSDFFSSYQKVIELDESNAGMSLLHVLHSLTEEDLRHIHNISKEISVDLKLISDIKPYWNEFSTKEKMQLLESIRDSFFQEEGMTSTLKVVSELIRTYPGMIDDFYESLNRESIKYLVNSFSKALQNNEFKDELDSFLSYENFEQLLRLFGRDEIVPKESKPRRSSARVNQDIAVAPIESCLQALFKDAKQNYNFWSLLETYPEVCKTLPENKKEVAHLVFEWTFDIDRIFLSYTGKSFAIDYGVISPDMMRYYHELIHLTNRHIDRSNMNYVSSTIEHIRNHLFDYKFLDVLNSITTLANNTLENNREKLDKSLELIIESDLNEVDESLKNILSVDKSSSKIQTSYSYTKKLNSAVGERTSITKESLLKTTLKAKELLLNDNDGSSLLKSIVELVHPDGGVTIPLFQKNQRVFKFDLQQLLLFLYDASSTGTSENVHYQDADGSIDIELTLIQRLELVIREIGFLENFYGAFFINKISKAEDYTKDIKKMKKMLKVIDKTSGLFRKLGVFPNETKWAFKNINQAYDSLWQLNDGEMNYGDLVQSILATTVISSPIRAQSFSAIRKPDLQRVMRHNGKFIKLLTENSVLTHISFFIRENFTRDELINNSELIDTAKNFLKLISKSELQELIELVLRHKNFEPILMDFLSEEVNIMEKMPSLIQLAADLSKTLKNNELGNVKWIVELVMDNYINFDKHNEVVSSVEEYFLNFSTMGKAQRISALSLIRYLPKNLIVKDADIISFLTNLSLYLGKVDNNSLFFNKIIGDNDFHFTPVLKMLQSTYRKDGNFNYFYGVINVLAAEEDGSTMLGHGFKKLFVEKSNQLSQFLADIFARFEDQSIAK